MRSKADEMVNLI